MTQREDLVILFCAFAFVNVLSFNYAALQLRADRFEDTHRILYAFGVINGILSIASLWMHLYKFLPLRILVDLLLTGTMSFSVYTFMTNILVLNEQVVYGYLVCAFGTSAIAALLIMTFLCSKPDRGHTIAESFKVGISLGVFIQFIGYLAIAIYYMITFERNDSPGVTDYIFGVLSFGILVSFVFHVTRYACRPVNRKLMMYLDFLIANSILLLLCSMSDNIYLDTLAQLMICTFFAQVLQTALDVHELPCKDSVDVVSGGDMTSATINPTSDQTIRSSIAKTFGTDDGDEETPQTKSKSLDTSLEDIDVDVISPDPGSGVNSMTKREHTTQVICSIITALCEIMFLVLSTCASGIPKPYSDEWSVVVIFIYTAMVTSTTSNLLIILRYLNRSLIHYCTLAIISGASAVSCGLAFFIWLQSEKKQESISDVSQSWSFLFALLAVFTSMIVTILTISSYYRSFMIKLD